MDLRSTARLALAALVVSSSARAEDGAHVRDLALASLGKGEVAEAQSLLRRALALDAQADLEDPRVDRRLRRVSSLSLLASMLAAGGDVGAAEATLRASVRLSEVHPRLRGPDVADALSGLARLLVERGELGEAGRLARRAAKMYDKTTGARHTERIDTLITMAAVRSARGDIRGAESLLRDAGRAAELEHARAGLRAAAAASLGSLRMGEGRHAEAEPLLEEGLERAEEAVGARHPALVRILQSLADCYRLRTRDDDAEILYRRALELAEAAFGANSPAAIPSLTGLALVDERRGDDAGAERWYRQALAIAEESADVSVRAALLGDMAAFFVRQGATGTARHLYLRAGIPPDGASRQDGRHRRGGSAK
jgi:tetratricopeptide (TPR) repeat protein